MNLGGNTIQAVRCDGLIRVLYLYALYYLSAYIFIYNDVDQYHSREIFHWIQMY